MSPRVRETTDSPLIPAAATVTSNLPAPVPPVVVSRNECPCQVIKLTEVVCGVGNVLQNKGGIGAYVRVDRTTFLFVAAHLAAHQASDSVRPRAVWPQIPQSTAAVRMAVHFIEGSISVGVKRIETLQHMCGKTRKLVRRQSCFARQQG